MMVVVMKIAGLILICHVVLLLQACSSGSLQRLGFEAMKNAGQQRCYKELRSSCDEHESYDVYQQKRESAQMQ